MRKRAFITLIAGATAIWPFIARTEVSRRVGFLCTTSAQAAATIGSLEATIQGLKEHGWIEGQNITFEYRFADGRQDALPKLAADLVRLRVDAIVEARNETARQRIISEPDDRDSFGGIFRGLHCRRALGHDGIDAQSHQFRRELRQGIPFSVGKAILEGNVLPFDPAVFL